ncbi:response regulator [Rudanella paleaurantiibacter]|uniref:Response regulator n=1 Tax=Rudanella paleaurantiibacter TaxID=2614655 RepID=A0A7J5U208_9BACT|nr:response regulator [Rudanella paleaurantiibacter]KAB7731726.1 response regulator [Rudanella paleaurantiibacter]
MDHSINILIVEDEAILAMALCDSLEAEGYCVVGMASNGAKAVDLFRRNRVDLLLCDINIRGELDGIETAHQLLRIRPVPIIYLTAFSDPDTVERAKQTAPAAYMTKPHNLLNLRIAIDVAIHNFARQTQLLPGSASPEAALTAEKKPDAPERDPPGRDTILKIDDYVFVKQGFQFVKISLADILVLEAEDTYTVFVTTVKKYALRQSLSAVLERLNHPRFVRVHRSYAINVNRVDTFDDHGITLGSQSVPLGKNYKDEFMRRLQVR